HTNAAELYDVDPDRDGADWRRPGEGTAANELPGQCDTGAGRRRRRPRGRRQSNESSRKEHMAEEIEYRIEHDTMGEVRVPKNATYSAQNQRAVENFQISDSVLSRHHIAALAQIKYAAAQANTELGVIDAQRAEAIQAAAARVIAGEFDHDFPIDVFQTGSGTSSNMNTNEVIATLASTESTEVHPNDHVNASQSSNDVFPSSIHIAATQAAMTELLPALEKLAASLQRKSEEFADVVKAGRTHLMDATPVTLGQEFGGYAQQI